MTHLRFKNTAIVIAVSPNIAKYFANRFWHIFFKVHFLKTFGGILVLYSLFYRIKDFFKKNHKLNGQSRLEK